ncbi:MAG: NADH-ubiquinone oxidoreductase subunit NDUFA12 family protein [Alphaproteobacteria bacterium]|nr:NADH-ubiquinone oxidoreductase subunit NDUFA12 family protein [Alphaproteobacteria bacterium]
MTNFYMKIQSWLYGVFVGQDEFHNRYYYHKNDKTKKWVMYKGLSDASKVPACWHGWLHHNMPVPLSPQLAPFYHKTHYPNLTGTDYQNIPKDTTVNAPHQSGYKPWKP